METGPDAGNGPTPAKPRRRGSRGGKNRTQRPAGAGTASGGQRPSASGGSSRDSDVELPDPPNEGRISDPKVAEAALVRKPQIGDTRPAPTMPPPGPATPSGGSASKGGDAKKRRRRGGRGRGQGGQGGRGQGGRGQAEDSGGDVDARIIERRRGQVRDGRPVGRYMMCVQVRDGVTQVAVTEGRNLIEHYVSRPADDVSQIHGNIYLARVQNVLPGMEAAFVDIGTPKNAVLYRGDVQFDAEDVETTQTARIEHILRPRQMILCQVTKNPIGAKGARLTQEVSLPGRFVVLIPNSKTYGISKRLPDGERRRLRSVLDKVKPAEHGVIVRTAAEHATEQELTADMTRLVAQWVEIEEKSKQASGPTLLYREPELAVRIIREEFTADYRGIVIDDERLHADVKAYVGDFNPELADRVELFDPSAHGGLSLYEHHHIHEQIHKALDKKVWLPSGGSLIIEHTEALTVIDVNTGKNVGTSSLEETVFRNNLEAAEEVARQLRLRDIGGIIVIDFIDMEVKDNRKKVVESFRMALARDKTRTQVFDISELGLVEMTRKRIGEGLLTSFAGQCPECEGRGVTLDYSLLD